ncbi:MAG: uncharacterized membrane protein YbhN (UPF0104 family) [Myxococcota bacterium]|jgi:uncharacterized membrane protein YbhN (UPF0104 family)
MLSTMTEDADPESIVTENPMDPEAPTQSARGKKGTLVTWAKKIAPWAITAAIFYYLFSEVPIGDAWEAAQSARLGVFLPSMLAAVLLWFLIDSAAFAFLFTRYNEVLEWSEARSLRGMTYLVTPINWNLGTAAIVLHLRSSKGIGAVASSSTLIFYQTIDGTVLAGFVALGVMLLPDSADVIALRNGASIFVAVQLLVLAFFIGDWPRFEWCKRVRGLGLFQSHRKARARDVFIVIALKSLYFSAFVFVYWFGCQSFGIEVPLMVAIASTPAILMAGSLPFTPAGLGTQQAAMLYFYSPFGTEAAILAFGLTFPVALLLFRCLVGLPYLKDLPKLREEMATQREAV